MEEVGLGGREGEEKVQGAASQFLCPKTRSGVLDNCTDRPALVSTLEKH